MQYPRDIQKYLHPCAHIDFDHERVRQTARAFARAASSRLELVRLCYEFVRDSIRHGVDFQSNPVTCRASDVLLHRTGFCYAKSHLLAALLRANGIPAGLCYQRLSVGGRGAPYCLHGLNAVYLDDFGWYRLDARGNKPGVCARFSPPREALAFPIRDPEERDLPEIWVEPLPVVVAALETYRDYKDLLANLPDIQVVNRRGE